MADMGDLANYMNTFAQHNPALAVANIVACRIAAAIVENLALNTPADVGDAVSNWQVTLDVPAPAVVPAFAPSPKGSVKHGVWTHKVPPSVTIVNNAPSVLASAKTVLTGKQPGQTIYITNNVEYIKELDAGSSTQAAAGLAARAQIAGDQAFQRAKQQVNAINALNLPVIP